MGGPLLQTEIAVAAAAYTSSADWSGTAAKILPQNRVLRSAAFWSPPGAAALLSKSGTVVAVANA